jgi:energy-coupling factor transport system substrate-specific component
MDNPARHPTVTQRRTLNSKQIAFVSAFIAIGAVVRIGVDEVAMVSPEPVYGMVIKVGLSETLSFVSGLVFGPVAGFLTGFSIILLSDLAIAPGAWTPFIASIIGLIGLFGGVLRYARRQPSAKMMLIYAVPLTLLSEFLQNAWVSVFFNTPILLTMLTGAPTLVTALANNMILFPTIGFKTIKFLQNHVAVRNGKDGLKQ